MHPLVKHVSGLVVTQGSGVGEPFKVLPWQRRFLMDVGRPEEGDVALSIARGGGKTTLVAALADCYLRGPLRQPRAEVLVVASRFKQARLVLEHLLGFVGEDRSGLKIYDSRNEAQIECKATGARVRCVASDPAGLHGPAPIAILADEPSQYKPTQVDRVFAALETGLGKIEGIPNRLIALGTRPATEDHPFEKMIAGGAEFVHCYKAGEDDPPFQRRTWKKACPSLDHFPHLERRIRKEASRARKDPSLLPRFRALRLNQGVADEVQATLLDAGTWSRIESDSWSQARRFVLAVDAGSTEAMSAVAAYWPSSGRLAVIACFPERPGLAERGLQDGVGRRYLDMHRAGDLLIAGRRTSDLSALLQETVRRWGRASALVCDTYRVKDLKDALEDVRYPRVPLTVRRMGFGDGSEDLRLFRRACLDGKVKPERSLLLRSAMGEARVTFDNSGNSRLAKKVEGGRRHRARDDAAAAALLAVAEGCRRQESGRKGLRHAVV